MMKPIIPKRHRYAFENINEGERLSSFSWSLITLSQGIATICSENHKTNLQGGKAKLFALQLCETMCTGSYPAIALRKDPRT